MPVDALLAALGELYPPKRLLTERAQLVPFESDALTAFRARPEAVVLAETQAEVIETVRLCHRESVPFVARGSGTSLSGGSLPVEGGIVIALNRLNRVLHLDPDQRIAVVEPGVINDHVSRAAAPHGLAYAPDPSSQSVCTIGGNLAFNSGGAHCLKHGMTANHVLGIKAVLPDGEVVSLGGESTEPVGPDWTGMFCGSEGLFGIALEVTLRLIPVAETTHTVLAGYDSTQAAGDAVAEEDQGRERAAPEDGAEVPQLPLRVRPVVHHRQVEVGDRLAGEDEPAGRGETGLEARQVVRAQGLRRPHSAPEPGGRVH